MWEGSVPIVRESSQTFLSCFAIEYHPMMVVGRRMRRVVRMATVLVRRSGRVVVGMGSPVVIYFSRKVRLCEDLL